MSGKCSLCGERQCKSDSAQFEIKPWLLPVEAKRFRRQILSLWACDRCGVIEIYHQKHGSVGIYGILLDRFWRGQFRRNPTMSSAEANALYDEKGYGKVIPRAQFLRDFDFNRKIWAQYKGPKPREISTEHNRLFD